MIISMKVDEGDIEKYVVKDNRPEHLFVGNISYVQEILVGDKLATIKYFDGKKRFIFNHRIISYTEDGKDNE